MSFCKHCLAVCAPTDLRMLYVVAICATAAVFCPPAATTTAATASNADMKPRMMPRPSGQKGSRSASPITQAKTSPMMVAGFSRRSPPLKSNIITPWDSQSSVGKPKNDAMRLTMALSCWMSTFDPLSNL